MAANSPPPVYLVELLDPHLVTHQKSDVSRFLQNAIGTVHKHLEEFAEPVTVEVQVDIASGEMAGIVFFTEEEEAIAVIRPYYLDREDVECTNPDIVKAAEGPLSKLEKLLNRTFER
jgi:hypothetical protein